MTQQIIQQNVIDNDDLSFYNICATCMEVVEDAQQLAVHRSRHGLGSDGRVLFPHALRMRDLVVLRNGRTTTDTDK